MAKGVWERRPWLRRAALIPIAVIIAFGVYVCYLRIFGGQTLQQSASPDGRAIAEVNTTGAAGATDTAYKGVMLRSRLNPFRTYVFAGLDYGAQISISWIDSKDLLVSCTGCAKLKGGDLKLDRWRDIAIHYEFR